MKAIFLIGVLFFSQVFCEASYNITAVSTTCDDEKGEFLELTVKGDQSSDIPPAFELILKGEKEEKITASCSFQNALNTHLSDEMKLETTNEFLSDETNSNKHLEPESTFEAFVTDKNSDEFSSKEIETSSVNPTRFLQVSSDTEYIAYCFFKAPEEKGNYTLELEDNSLFTFDDEKLKTIEAIPCLILEDAKKRMDIFLTFRQVSKFNLSSFLFYFYAFTTKPIKADYSFSFFFYLMNGPTKLPQKQECICKVEAAVELGTEKIAPAPFKCEFKNKDLTGFDSIQLISSESVAGLPTNSTLLNPKLTDDAISKGLLPDFSKVTIIPPLVEISKKNFENVEDKGIFDMTINIEKTDNLKKGQKFNIPLAFPSGVILICTITNIQDNTVTINCKIDGKVQNKPLIIEQTSIVVGGVELFVLPSFQTDPITTEGSEKEEEKEEEEKEEEKEEEEKEEEEDNEITQTTTGGNMTEYWDEDKPMTKEEAEKKAQLFISFRQMNTFTFKPGSISFFLLLLTTKPLTKGETVKLKINLIGNEGMDDEAKEIKCTLESDVAEPSKGESLQGKYKCELSGLNTSITYTSARLNSSEDIAGIPTDDETALNPALTDDAIKNGEVKNCTKGDSVPPTFSFDEFNIANCSIDGKFIIKGNVSSNKTIVANKFTIPLTYPEGISITCNFVNGNIECIADKELNESIILEQTIVSEGAEELFILKNLSYDGIKCKNGLMAKAEEKEKVNISFRQVSHIKTIPNGLSFFFAAFVKANLKVPHTIPMNVFVVINGEKVEKEANCTLREAVTTSETPVQGDFDCVVSLESNETVAPENLTISTNNDDIGGCSELTKEEASPKLTDDAIEETKNKPDLGKVIDFSLPENKIKTPSTFEVTAMNLDKCEKKGKIKVTGKFTEDIKEEKTFEIPFSFPAYKIKCTVDPVAKDTSTDIICKMQKTKKFFGFKSLILEPRLLKKKKMEMFYIKYFKHEKNNEMSCDNYNEIKLKRVKAKKNAPFTFLQMARPPSYKHLFFIALMKKSSVTTFQNRTINVSLTLIKNSRRRVLDTLDLTDELKVSCEVGNTEGDAGALDCTNEDITLDVSKADIEDSNIGGTSDDVKVESNPNPDYSQKESLKAVNDLPTVTITKISQTNCASTGEYTIEGNLIGTLNESLSLDDVTIPFSTPDSSGLCSITKEDDKLTMDCQNTEEFTTSQITVPAQVIKDKSGNLLFRITEDYTADTQFACAISENSEKSENNKGNDRMYFRQHSSGGLSGGAIAAIVISCVVVVAIVTIIALLLRKNICGKSKIALPEASIDKNNTVNRFTTNENP